MIHIGCVWKPQDMPEESPLQSFHSPSSARSVTISPYNRSFAYFLTHKPQMKLRLTLTYITPQDTYQLVQQHCASQTGAGVQSRPQSMPTYMDCEPCGHAGIHSHSVWYNSLHPRNPRYYTDYYQYTDHGGTEG